MQFNSSHRASVIRPSAVVIGIALPLWLVTAAPQAVAYTSAASMRVGGLAEAPTGHRQPRAADLPAGVRQSEETVTQGDREIDRMIDICRDC